MPKTKSKPSCNPRVKKPSPNDSKPLTPSTPLSLEVIRARRSAIDAELESVRLQRQEVDRVLSEVAHKAELTLLKAELQTELASTHADRASGFADSARRNADRAEQARQDPVALLGLVIGVSFIISLITVTLSMRNHEPIQPTHPSPAAPIQRKGI
jgi:hypothetical protein